MTSFRATHAPSPTSGRSAAGLRSPARASKRSEVRDGALLVGNPDEVAEKILRHSEALGGIARLSFQMSVASLPHAKLMRAIELIGARVAPALRKG